MSIHHRTAAATSQSTGAIDLRVPDLATLCERRSEKWTGQEPDVLPLTVAEMDFPLAPEVTAALHAAVDRHDLGYTAPTAARTGAAFAGFAQRRLHWTVDPEHVTLVPDVMAGLIELCRILTEPAAQVAFFTPAYPPFFAELPQARVELVQLPLDTAGAVDLEALEAALAGGVRVLVLANPHNPTGQIVPRPVLEQIADLCVAHDAWVLADEIHAPLVLEGATHTPWLEVSDAARNCGIALSSASKAFNVAGLKAALVITASDRARDAVRRLPLLTDRVGILGIVAAEAAFTAGSMRSRLGWQQTARFLASCWRPSFPTSHGDHLRPPISPGWTVEPYLSATIRRPSFSSGAASRSVGDSITVARVPASSG
jgi:cysteine-S-conjugate beta-lyase